MSVYRVIGRGIYGVFVENSYIVRCLWGGYGCIWVWREVGEILFGSGFGCCCLCIWESVGR